MKVSFQYAETHLNELINAAARGEVIEIDTPGLHTQLVASTKTMAQAPGDEPPPAK